MKTMNYDMRKSGIPLIGDLPWGSHFCQFYQTTRDQLDILVPYFRAGLENKEACLWITSGALSPNNAKRALEKGVPHFEKYLKKGQLKIIPHEQWHTAEEASGKAIVSMLDEAISGGSDGLRLACEACPDKEGGRTFSCYGTEAIGRYNVLAVFEYPRDRFDAVGLMEVVKKHRFALVRNTDKWEVIESSEARTVKDALKRSEEKLQSLFSNMSEGFAYHRIVLDAHGKPCDYIFLEVNESFERLTGLKGKNILGKKATKALPGIEKDPTDWIGKYGVVALTQKPVQFESYSEQLKRWYSVSAFSPHKGFFAVTFNDITCRKTTEEELLKHRNALEASNKELEAFSYSVSHDLRSPLRAIDGFSRIILEDYRDKLDDEGKRLLNIIRKNTRDMGQLIDDLLAFSRIGRQQLTLSGIDMGGLAEMVFEDLKALAPGRAISLVLKDPPPALADKALVRQVLINLLSNAVKFTRDASAAHIEFGGRAEKNENVYYVKDNGVGFNMQYVDKIFGVFQRLHSVDEFEGTGVGLAIVQRIVLMHGGRGRAEGKLNEGATFYFTLPKQSNTREL